ncbi:MAG: hypothetical protein R3D59_14665 [Paracoccaceae bacterium]
MSNIIVKSPSSDEIQDIISAARVARAKVIRGWLHAAFVWLTRPHFGGHSAAGHGRA